MELCPPCRESRAEHPLESSLSPVRKDTNEEKRTATLRDISPEMPKGVISVRKDIAEQNAEEAICPKERKCDWSRQNAQLLGCDESDEIGRDPGFLLEKP